MAFRKRTEVLLASSAFLCLAALLGHLVVVGIEEGRLSYVLFLAGACSVACVLGFVLCVDIYRLNPADSHTLHTLLLQYCYLLLLRLRLPYTKWMVNRQLMDPKKASEKALLRILHRNQYSAYGRQYKFDLIRSRDDFIRAHPLTTQHHYAEYMDRIAQGEVNVLHDGRTEVLVGTSGTTGVSKIYPFTAQHVTTSKYILRQVCPISYAHLVNLQRYAQFHIHSPVRRSPGGIPIGAGTQFLFSFPAYNLIPQAYSKLYSEDASYYAQAVFSLAEAELRYISGFSADMMYSYFKFIVKHWEHLCDDIARGEIGCHVSSMLDDVRVELSRHLRADPARAADLKAAMKKGIVGLAKRIWVDIEFILMGKSAGFSLCTGILMDNQFSGLKVIDFCHAATEGVTGINIESQLAHVDSIFTLLLFSDYFLEFIPLGEVDEEHPGTVFPEELEVGEMYEVVHTNINGLYRCRYGDIIKVVGFNKNTPKYRFVYKLGQRLNIAYERTPDRYLIEAVRHQQKELPGHVTIVDFTSTESVVLERMLSRDHPDTEVTSKGHYVFFVEFNTDQTIDTTSLAEKIDKHLLQLYEQYKRFKDIGSIGPLRLIQVRCSTFDGLKRFIWNNTPHGQFKMPRVLRREPALQYLLTQAVPPL